jgi:signal transduction histidine kinase
MKSSQTKSDMQAIPSPDSGWRATDVFLFVLSALIILLFYATPLHEQTENLLFDFVSVVKPDLMNESPVVIVASSAADAVQPAVNPETKEQTLNILDPHILLPEMQAILTDPSVKILVVMLYPNFFSYTDPHLEQIVDLAFADPRVYIGVLGIDTEFPSVRRLPDQFGRVSERVLGIETFRARRHQTIRQLPLNGFRGMTPTLLLAPSIAEKLKVINDDKTLDIRSLLNRNAWAVHWFRPNYRSPSDVTVVQSADLNDETQRQKLQDKIVLLGPTKYRERPINNEQVYVNTPWQREGNDPMLGETLASLTAVSLENLLNGSQLSAAPMELGWIAIEAILVILLFSMPWRRGIIVAVAVIVSTGALVLVIHGVLMSYFAIYLPLQHTALMGTLAMIAGGAWRVRFETEIRLSEQARTDARADLARVQGRFLNRFATELSEINLHILKLLQNVWPQISAGKNTGSLAQKLRESSQEFDEYLKGIRQFADLPESGRVNIQRNKFSVLEMINRIMSNFETRRDEHKLQVRVDVSSDVELRTDQTMVEAVLFNLISNAFKYTPDGGDISISVQAKANSLVFEVYNSGPGIKQEFHEKIFERFYRVQDAYTTGIKGNGLGLYLCRYFAGILGGSVNVSSLPNQGATFTFVVGAK